MMEQERIYYLLQRYAAGEATQAELEELQTLAGNAAMEEPLQRLVLQQSDEPALIDPVNEPDWEQTWAAICRATKGKSHNRHFPAARPLRLAAAAVLLLLAGVAYLLYRPQVKQPLVAARPVIVPGGNRATLTLADGRVMVLDSAENGNWWQQGGSRVIKLNDGRLAYQASGAQGATVFNTIATPRGGQYQVVLPDGTRVWLNAASSLHFPTVFSGAERVVELTGEAYFEVAALTAMPFHVKVLPPQPGRRAMDVQVLGTRFNIMAYANEPAVRTTLLQGRVKVQQQGAAAQLEPGTEAVLQPGGTIQVQQANLEQAVAWKNGVFRFKETGIRELMRQVERWYDVEVEFRTGLVNQDFTGVVPRSGEVKGLLDMLELTGTVHFNLQGKKIIVLP